MGIQYGRVCVAVCLAAHLLSAQTAKPEPDVLELVDGEKLLGHFEQSNGASIKFKSDALGEVTVDWSKVRELHTSQKFAVLPKDLKLKKNADVSKIPQGNIAAADQKITVTPSTGPVQTIAVADADHVIEQTSFENAVNRTPSFFTDWGGGVTAGASLVQARRKAGPSPGPSIWCRQCPTRIGSAEGIELRSTSAFPTGLWSSPRRPLVKTEIYHGDIQRDEYLSNSLFAFVQGSFDHNFSQGLNLQQTYGGGLGWSVIKRPNESLDLKAGVTYVRQEFYTASAGQSLAGSTFEEDFTRGLRRGIKFSEQLIIAPAWTNTNALTATGSTTFTVPVYKRTNFSLGTINNYLHDPPPGLKRTRSR